MAIVQHNDAAIAQAAQVQQAVQAALNAVPQASAVAVAPAVVAPATITNDPVVLPATGAAPEAVAEPVNVVAPAQAEAPAVAPETAPAEPTVPLTKTQQLQGKIDALAKRIDADTKKRDELSALLRSVDLLESIKGGSIIVARVGRAETSKEVTAQVLGVASLENGDKRFKIFYGEGLDAETAVIQESQILDVKQV